MGAPVAVRGVFPLGQLLSRTWYQLLPMAEGMLLAAMTFTLLVQILIIFDRFFAIRRK
jgi:hypothetical protein